MSTQIQLQTLFEDILLGSQRTDLTTDPTSTLITTFLNNAIIKENLRMRPQEMRVVTPLLFDIVVSTNQVSIGTVFDRIDHVYYQHTSNSVYEVFARQFTPLVQGPGVSSFFNTDQTGIPNNYELLSNTLLFDKYFNRTETDQIKVYGLLAPGALSVDLPDVDSGISNVYDMLIIYRAALFFYEREEDTGMWDRYERRITKEEQELWQDRGTPPGRARIELDKRYFLPHGNVNFNNSEVFFTK